MICTMVFFVFNVIIHEAQGKSKLYAVSKFEGLENFHMWVRNKPLDSSLKYYFKRTRKNRLCRRIFAGAHFNYLGIAPKIFNTSHIHPYRYMSRTKEIYVYNKAFRGTVDERVFKCRCTTMSIPSRMSTTKYFVSEEYDVSDFLERYIAGRFIFGRQNGLFYYEALAEEPATIVEGENVEKQYLTARGNREIATTDSADPLCRLDLPKKLRICTLVLSSSYFMANEVKFGGSLEYVFGQCHKRRIMFRTDYTRTIVNERIYEEWMMMCMAKSPTEPRIPLYLSRAYASQKLFVYSKEFNTERTFLEILADDVRGVIDEVG